MSEKAKKTITVGDLIFQKYGQEISNMPTISLPDFSGIQKTMQSIQPALNRTMEAYQKLKDHEDRFSVSPIIPDHQVVMENYRPTSSYILEEQRNIVDELRKLNEYLAPRDKKKSLIFFNEKTKTFIRDTDSVSYKCKFSETGMNFKLIISLFDHDGFRQTRHLKQDIGSKTDEAVRKKVQKINEEFSKKLRKADLRLIIGESGAGYRINPELKIQMI